MTYWGSLRGMATGSLRGIGMATGSLRGIGMATGSLRGIGMATGSLRGIGIGSSSGIGIGSSSGIGIGSSKDIEGSVISVFRRLSSMVIPLRISSISKFISFVSIVGKCWASVGTAGITGWTSGCSASITIMQQSQQQYTLNFRKRLMVTLFNLWKLN